MKKKIIGILVDVILISIVFGVTDAVQRKVFHSENFWLKFGIYVVFYAIVFGCKSGIVILWNRFVSNKKRKTETTMQNPPLQPDAKESDT